MVSGNHFPNWDFSRKVTSVSRTGKLQRTFSGDERGGGPAGSPQLAVNHADYERPREDDYKAPSVHFIEKKIHLVGN